MYRVLVANGVNLDLLGSRPKQFYGDKNLEDLRQFLAKEAGVLEKIFKIPVEITFFQSNDEATYLQKLSENWDGAILNPGAWTHTSLALADRIEALQLPFVEVHLSQLAKRESWRQGSFVTKHALGVIYGFGFDSYVLGLNAILRYLVASDVAV